MLPLQQVLRRPVQNGSTPGATIIELLRLGDRISVVLVSPDGIPLITFDVSLKNQSLYLAGRLVINSRDGGCRIEICCGLGPLPLLGLEPAARQERRRLAPGRRGLVHRFRSVEQVIDERVEAFDILEQAGVGVTPGIDFGKNGEGYLRFSYANSLANIKEGMDRLESYLEALIR